jgi:hypothetical protein
MFAQVKTARDVIAALGGVDAVAGKLGTSQNVVHNWKQRGLPAESFWALNKLLSEEKIEAPRSLWRQYELK